MIKKIAWNTFKNTGNLDTYLELKQIQNIEAQMSMQNNEMEQNQINVKNGIMQQIQQQMEEQNGNNQNEWYNNFGK